MTRRRAAGALLAAGLVCGLTTAVPPAAAAPASTTASLGPGCRPGQLVTGVATRKKYVALTFDDGPSAQTPQFLQVLKQRSAPATFFVLGRQARIYPEVVRRTARMGFEVANHSVSHSYTPPVIASEVAPMNALLQRLTGYPPRYFRSPGLTRSDLIQQALARSGQCNVFTDRDLQDWRAPRHSAGQICTAFRQALHPGYVALLHDGIDHVQTLQALPCIIDTARREGYVVVGLRQLLQSGRATS